MWENSEPLRSNENIKLTTADTSVRMSNFLSGREFHTNQSAGFHGYAGVWHRQVQGGQFRVGRQRRSRRAAHGLKDVNSDLVRPNCDLNVKGLGECGDEFGGQGACSRAGHLRWKLWRERHVGEDI